jgi:hypothetical protein
MKHPNKPQPYNVGINRQKRLARRADKRDRAVVVARWPGTPKKAEHHQLIVQARHQAYRNSPN